MKKSWTFLFKRKSCNNEADQNSLLYQKLQKLLKEKLQTSERKFPVQKNIIARTYHFPISLILTTDALNTSYSLLHT